MEKNNFFIILAILGTIQLTSGTIRVSYGQHCNETIRCNSRAWLSCVNGVCACVKQDEMHFDDQKAKCVTRSGERCKYGLEESGENILIQITQCTQNAKCSPEGLCVCDNRYQETFSGLCTPSKLFGENCTKDNECSLYDGLTCVDGICKCNQSISMSSENTCVGLSQKPCINNNCIEGATCDQGSCVCSDDYRHNSSTNLCSPAKNIFESCKVDDECIQAPNLVLACVNGVCNCNDVGYAYAVVQKYESKHPYSGNFVGPKVTMCAPIVGQECPDGFCVTGAKCKVPRGTVPSPGKCECSPPYQASKNGAACGKGHRSSCESNDECIHPLVCADRSCVCPMFTHQTYNSTEKACTTIVGARCTNETSCVPNAFCKPIRTGSLNGHCRCLEGYSEGRSGDCMTSFGGGCSRSADCNPSFICVNRQCACKDQMYRYEPQEEKCLGVVGAKCVNATLGCVDNAECLKRDTHLTTKCQCKVGFIESSVDYTCQLPTTEE